MGTTSLEGILIITSYLFLVIFFKEHWENILAMRIRNKHLEPRGCDTIGDTITDEKVSFFFFHQEKIKMNINRFVVYIFLLV